MTRADREDMVVIGMGINVLLECVRQTEAWWRVRGDGTARRRTEQLSGAILATRRKFFDDISQPDAQIAEALIVADGLRDAASSGEASPFRCPSVVAKLKVRNIDSERMLLRNECGEGSRNRNARLDSLSVSS